MLCLVKKEGNVETKNCYSFRERTTNEHAFTLKLQIYMIFPDFKSIKYYYTLKMY